MNDNPYQILGSLDPFGVAHTLGMPAALFEAFKKTMCGGMCGYKDAETNYRQAIDCLKRFKADFDAGLFTRPAPSQYPQGFHGKVAHVYFNFLKPRIKAAGDFNERLMLYCAFYAGHEQLQMYAPNRPPLEDCINSAIELLEQALHFCAQRQTPPRAQEQDIIFDDDIQDDANRGAFAEGNKDASTGYFTNPYPAGSQEHQAWIDGAMKARQAGVS